MPLTKVPARDFLIEINAGAGSGDAADWIPIGGLTSMTPSPASQTADTTDFDSAGRAEHMVMERGLSFTISGHHKEDVQTGERDPGQLAVETLAKAVGINSHARFRHTSPGGNVRVFWASAEVTPAGGGHNDAAAWSATITISGPVEEE